MALLVAEDTKAQDASCVRYAECQRVRDLPEAMARLEIIHSGSADKNHADMRTRYHHY